jgi:NAD-dependent SIR2 family protein deacetylase
MQSAGRVWSLLTQNVDRLHQRAGSVRVIEMHGTTHEVVCMDCGQRSCRHEMQAQLAALNPDFHVGTNTSAVPGMEQARPSVGRVVESGQVRPDGDTDAAVSELASEPRSKVRRADGALALIHPGTHRAPGAGCNESRAVAWSRGKGAAA